MQCEKKLAAVYNYTKLVADVRYIYIQMYCKQSFGKTE